jgi:hypothetical protein
MVEVIHEDLCGDPVEVALDAIAPRSIVKYVDVQITVLIRAAADDRPGGDNCDGVRGRLDKGQLFLQCRFVYWHQSKISHSITIPAR